ncbi:ABC transporter substrate-binding protein [Aldersonia sp. NBC_00410]|uniref:ABC transporter substrate-binding protein n=1 Tax=Aldersonia sp. NBC_00410 TaxID=2975954 RepID=UPI0022503100|nr:ABC transporter substrate-binding protein [Aldersonia sp. NBC_00410]MCX5045303.1 ABC transporter substrate-binding protein [Aldersonia sp. NBC_00410]
MSGADGRRARVIVAVLAAFGVTAGVLTGCSQESPVPSIGYAIDNLITTYNANTTAGASSGALAAFGRTLTGLSYVGPLGGPVTDTDAGTATVVPGDALTVQYRLNPDGVYSDGTPTTCDDLVLAWVANSGRFLRSGDGGARLPMFDSADTAGYSDIDRVECQPGAKDATVVFRPGQGFTEWQTLFSATELMPAHIAARAAGVDSVVTTVQAGDQQGLGRIADFWNTGWNLTPGQLDTALFPSSGPYRISSYSEDDGLVLVANERWWGNKPQTPRIVLWPKNFDIAAKVDDDAVQVIDIGAESVPGLDMKDFVTANVPSRNAEQLVLSTGGVLANPEARRALALCAPRTALFDQLGHPGFENARGLGSGVLNSRIVQQDTLIYPPVAAGGAVFPGGDVPGAVDALGRAGVTNPTVRIGYLAPDDRRAKTVTAIADACKPAGITVEDASGPQFGPQELRAGKVDAVLTGTASAPGTAGAAFDTDALNALRGGSASNFGGFANPRYDAIVAQLGTDPSPDSQLNLSTEAENLLWSELPSIPLFAQPRTIAFAQGLGAGVPNPTKAGTGWNMDRWVLKR